MTPRDVYRARLAAGGIEPDPAQEMAVARLDRLAQELKARQRRGWGAWAASLTAAAANPEPRGLYLWGEVGRGKTMLMDLFYASLPSTLPKRRAHFAEFMNDAHDRIFHRRMEARHEKNSREDPVIQVADALASEAPLLCLDEFAVTDIADAMILKRVFTRLFERNVVVVATSNVAPRRLYENGLNRTLFLPFVDLIEERMDVLELKARADYRLEKLSGGATYLLTGDPHTATALDAFFHRLTGLAFGPSRRLDVKGRQLIVPQAAMGVARFSFTDLCEKPLSAADYLVLAETFHTLIIDNVPVLGPDRRDAAKRFITLIDTLYDRGVKLVMSAAAEPSALYEGKTGPEAFEFSRTASRLIEMRSEAYLAQPHGGLGRHPIVET